MNMKEQNKDIIASQEDYKYDFKDEDVTIFNTGKGLSEEVIREISKTKEEPEWMLELRLEAYHKLGGNSYIKDVTKEFEEIPLK